MFSTSAAMCHGWAVLSLAVKGVLTICCGSMSELWREISQDDERYGFYLEVKGSQEKRQQGIFRCSNCIQHTHPSSELSRPYST